MVVIKLIIECLMYVMVFKFGHQSNSISFRISRATMRYHLTLVKMAIIKRSANNKTGRGVLKMASSYSVGENVSWYSHYGEQYGRSLKN